ncbi:MAG: hypothetical protein HYY01_04150 [Chloroflexi bacterium]|nr:hypothetical protein [Chloroflexota bacterium]
MQSTRRKTDDRLLNKIKRLERRVASLEAITLATDRPDVIVLRTMSREQAKHEIRELFGSGAVLYFSDIARQLRLDLPLVVEICNELISEGNVEVATDAV